MRYGKLLRYSFDACRTKPWPRWTAPILISLLPKVERHNNPVVVDATDRGKDAVVRQKGGYGWDGLVHGSQRDGSFQREGESEWRACGGSQSHRRGGGLRRGLRLPCCGELCLGLGLVGAGRGGTRGWGRAGEGGSGAAAGRLGVRQVSVPPSRRGGGGSRRRRGVQGGLGG